MLSSAYFCMLAYVKICHAFPVEGRRYGARLSQPLLKHFVYRNHFQAVFQAALTSGWLEEFPCHRHFLQTPLPSPASSGGYLRSPKAGLHAEMGV